MLNAFDVVAPLLPPSLACAPLLLLALLLLLPLLSFSLVSRPAHRRRAQMLECLKGVHACGYLHRDVKPANFVRRKKNAKEFVIIDFGEGRNRASWVDVFKVERMRPWGAECGRMRELGRRVQG